MAPNPAELSRMRATRSDTERQHGFFMDFSGQLYDWLMENCTNNDGQRLPVVVAQGRLYGFVIDGASLHPFLTSNAGKDLQIWMDVGMKKKAQEVQYNSKDTSLSSSLLVSWVGGSNQNFPKLTPERLREVIDSNLTNEVSWASLFEFANTLIACDSYERTLFVDWFAKGLLTASGHAEKWNDEMRKKCLDAFPQIHQSRVPTK